MATIRKLRGRWQASVRRKGLKPQAKSFDKKCDAERWARELESEIDQRGFIPDTKPAETMTLADLMRRYLLEITPRKRGAAVETVRITGMLKRDIMYRTLAMLNSADIAAYRDKRLETVAPATVVREIATR